MEEIFLNIKYRIQRPYQNLNFLTFSKNNYFDVKGFSQEHLKKFENQHLQHFCNWNYDSKTYDFQINYWLTIRRDILCIFIYHKSEESNYIKL